MDPEEGGYTWPFSKFYFEFFLYSSELITVSVRSDPFKVREMGQ